MQPLTRSEPDGSVMYPPLRAWQRRALTSYLSRSPRDFLAVATPGAGKTTFALRVARELLADRTVSQLTVVTPTEHLKTQWAAAASRMGIELDPKFSGGRGRTSSDYHGIATTYAGIAANPQLHRARTEARKTLVILDEVHHGGDALSWGDAIRLAFEPATRRLALTGTPFRTDDNPIPFVAYEPDGDGALRSVADHSYDYADALADGVVRPVIFLAYSGQTRWRTRAGDEIAVRLGEPLTKEHTQQAWRTALNPDGDWISSVLRAADVRLTQIRKGGVEDAAGLIIASDRNAARAYARRLTEATGQRPSVVLSDDPKSSAGIASFAESNDRWLVAVRMVSEGVDIPRLGVLVFATSVSTPLFFAQAVGRVVRARKAGETASVFLPSVPVLLGHAAEMETVRDHVLGKKKDAPGEWDDQLVAEANRKRDNADVDDGLSYEALEASAELDQVIFDGTSWGTSASAGSEEEEEYLGIPGLLAPEQVTMLLRQRQAQQQKRTGRLPSRPEPTRPAAHHEVLAALRRELNTLVSMEHHRTTRPHAQIHAELRTRCGGPPTPLATAEQLRARIDALRTR